MQFYAQRMKIIVEPTGCLSLAAARQLGDKLKGKKLVLLSVVAMSILCNMVIFYHKNN